MIAQITFIDNSGSNIELVTDDVSQLVTDEKSIMSIDGSTDITGVSIIGEASNRVIATVAFKRKDETAVAYKVRLKKAIETILRNNKHIKIYSTRNLHRICKRGKKFIDAEDIHRGIKN